MAISTHEPSNSPRRCRNCGEVTVQNTNRAVADSSRCPQCGEVPDDFQALLTILRQRMAAALEMPPAAIQEETPLFEIAGDSLATVELMLVLSDEFSVSLPEECLDEVATVGDLVGMIQQARRDVSA